MQGFVTTVAEEITVLSPKGDVELHQPLRVQFALSDILDLYPILIF